VIAALEGSHGPAIKEELETCYESEIHHGRLCPNLDTLVDKGLVEKGEKDRRTIVYTTRLNQTRMLSEPWCIAESSSRPRLALTLSWE
jgi:DNA-binding PadR family transcriptional regulator